jgi:hypothetical protein
MPLCSKSWQNIEGKGSNASQFFYIKRVPFPKLLSSTHARKILSKPVAARECILCQGMAVDTLCVGKRTFDDTRPGNIRCSTPAEAECIHLRPVSLGHISCKVHETLACLNLLQDSCPCACASERDHAQSTHYAAWKVLPGNPANSVDRGLFACC